MTKKEDMEFFSDLEAAANLKPSKASRIFLWTVTALFAWIFIWSALSEVDERVRGTGQIMPSGDIQVVQSLEGGIVTEILATEGDTVKKGQIILRIDDIHFASEGRGIEAQVASLQARQMRLKAEAGGEKFVIDPALAEKHPDIAENEAKLYASRQEELATALEIIRQEGKEAESLLAETNSNISRLSKSTGLLQKELDITRRLVEKNAQPEIEKIRLERELNEVSGNLSSAQQARQSSEARLAAVRQKEAEKKSALKSQALGELGEVETKISAIQESLASVNDKVSRTELRSPVDGVVHRLHVKTVGGVIEPAKKLVEIVPGDNDLMMRARISPADVAFLKPGQKVRVSVTAYDPQVYGTLNGRLERIGADTIEDAKGNVFFEIDVRTDKNHLGENMPIVPGMTGETEVIVGKRNILSYLMKPILRAKDRALTEK